MATEQLADTPQTPLEGVFPPECYQRLHASVVTGTPHDEHLDKPGVWTVCRAQPCPHRFYVEDNPRVRPYPPSNTELPDYTNLRIVGEYYNTPAHQRQLQFGTLIRKAPEYPCTLRTHVFPPEGNPLDLHFNTRGEPVACDYQPCAHRWYIEPGAGIADAVPCIPNQLKAIEEFLKERNLYKPLKEYYITTDKKKTTKPLPSASRAPTPSSGVSLPVSVGFV